MKRSILPYQHKRPLPPAGSGFFPGPELCDWALSVFVHEAGPLYDEVHAHLLEAEIGFLWTDTVAKRRGIEIAGDASLAKPMPTLTSWDKEIYWWNLRSWFPNEDLDFLIRISAPIAESYSDVDFCALIKHELLHCGQAVDEFGELRFKKDGRPMFAMRGHDVEQFVEVVRDFGAVGRNVREFVDAANKVPRLGQASATVACGTCLAKAA